MPKLIEVDYDPFAETKEKPKGLLVPGDADISNNSAANGSDVSTNTPTLTEVDYDPFSKPSALPVPAGERSVIGELVGGVKRSIPQFKETYANVLAAGGAITGLDTVKEYGLSKAKEYKEEAAAVAPETSVPSIVESYQKGTTLSDLP